MATVGLLSNNDLEIIDRHVKSAFARAEIIGKHLFALHEKTTISIKVPLAELQKSSKSYNLVKGKACLQNGDNSRYHIEVECFVACSETHLENLPSDQKEVDIIKHLRDLLPAKKSSKIKLVTCQNGIQNSFSSPNKDGDFEKMCLSITEKIKKEAPLFIGLYNRTSGKGYGFINDLQRLMNEWTLNPSSVISLRQLFASVIDKLSNTNHLWLHIAHSEGGLLTQNCLTHPRKGLFSQHKNLLKKHLLTLVFGGVSPVSDEACKEQANIYSTQDIALRLNGTHIDKFPYSSAPSDKQLQEIAKKNAQFWGTDEKQFYKQLLNGKEKAFITNYPHTSRKNGLTLRIVECIEKNLPPIIGDHAFSSRTYQVALKQYINDIRGRNKL
ncbi:MAG: hypothetical protein ChlgKO_02040 [Chlamydiales bacterium]